MQSDLQLYIVSLTMDHRVKVYMTNRFIGLVKSTLYPDADVWVCR